MGVFRLGVFGAAFATMLSQLLAGFGSLLYAFRRNPYFRLNKQSLAFDRDITRQAVRLGLPLALQWSLIAISTTALQSVVNTFGPTAMAAYSIREGFRDSLLAMLAVAGLMLAVMQLWGGSLVGMFVKETDVIALGEKALRITSCFYAFLGIIYVARGVLNGVGDAIFSFINGIVEIAGRVGLPLLLLHLTTAGVWSIWITAGVTWMLAGISCVMRYVAWRKKLEKKENINS